MAAERSTFSPPPRRACDRCRRRKAKCDRASPSSVICIKCRLSGEQCTFELPLAKRGPRKHPRNSKNLAHPVSVLPPAESLETNAAPRDPGQSVPVAAAPVHNPALLGPAGFPTSPASWESRMTIAESSLSPTVLTSISDSASTVVIPLLQRWHNLDRTLQLRDRSMILERVVDKCFNLFFQYLYPLIPLVHEPSLRNALSFFVSEAASIRSLEIANISETWSSSFLREGIAMNNLPDHTAEYPEVWADAAFTLITAVCAEAAFLLPKDIFREGEIIAKIFLKASRDCLTSYLEADLECPNANSVVIRYLHSNCVHATGRPRISWHILGEATRLAQEMQMHEEKSLQDLPTLEAELRRRAFWIVYIGDKSAAILNNCPTTLHAFSFDSGITTEYPTGIEDENNLFPDDPVPDGLTRRSCMEGFSASLRLWKTASDLILEIRLLKSQRERSLDPAKPLTAEERHRLDSLYVLFITSVDKVPPHLQADIFATTHVIRNTDIRDSLENNLMKQHIIQWTNIYVTLHCLKMVIVQKFEELGYYSPQGDHLDIQKLLRKTEIARDMLRVIREAPFWSLQVNGEPCVEKIRLIGASLLETIDQDETSPLAARAHNDFLVLLDILTRLDSRASDTLRRSL